MSRPPCDFIRCAGFLALVFLAAAASPAQACRATGSSEGTFTRHLGRDCTEAQRDAQAVPAGEILAALKSGRGIDLSGVTVTGDLSLDELPVTAISRESLDSAELRDTLSGMPARVITGPMLIRDSVVRGRIRTNLQDGTLLVTGPVLLAGSTFESPVDLSRAVFLSPVDASKAVFAQEAFFILSRFERPARFEKTAFGAHARFHKARFSDSASFARAGFNGMAEFIEVTFAKGANFSRTVFKRGTGFSGSRFAGPLDFSEATFERAAFFTFTVFEGDAYFRRTTFRAEANFSDAVFQGLDDFSKAFFNVEPRFTRTKATPERAPAGLQNPRLLYVIAGALFMFAVIFILQLRRR